MLHERYMNLALELAERARGCTSPNPLVGAVVVKEGEIVGQGYHMKAGTPHAEIHALNEAGANAEGGTLYVTLEPCSHFGRTPPCSSAVIKAGIQEVFIAMVDPNPLVAGRGIRQLEESGIKVNIGLCGEQAAAMNEIFIKYITTKRPFVLLKTAMTLDGKIATKNGDSKWVTGAAARHRVHQLRNEYDAILVGINTVLADDPALTCRLPEGGRDPIRIILDTQGRIPIDARVLTEKSDSSTYLVVTDRSPLEKIKTLSGTEAKILRADTDSKGRIDLPSLMNKLGEMHISSILVEGGAEIAASFLEEKLVDKVMSFIAPKLAGGSGAPTPVGGIGAAQMKHALWLNHTSFGQIGDDFYITGYPVYPTANRR